ncbi:MAG TPA: hypothetical protein VF746_02895 [Longimicrobium sp.]|jgi:hypothetical protein
MTRWTRFIPALAVGLVLAACGQDSGGNPVAPLGPSGPRMEGGLGTGGNYTGGSGGGPTTTSTTTGFGSDSTIIIESDTTSRGGLGTGGN